MDSRNNWMNRLNVIRELSSPVERGFENPVQIMKVVEQLILESRRNPTYHESLTYNLPRLLQNFQYLLKLLVPFLIDNIWKDKKSVITSKEILADLMKNYVKCSKIVMLAIRNETRKEVVLKMFNFLKEFGLYSEQFRNLRREIILETWLKVNDKMDLASSLEQTEPDLNYNKMFCLLSMMCREKRIAENSILKIFNPERVENLDGEETILFRFLEIIKVEDFLQVLDKLEKFVPDAMMNTVLLKFFKNEKNSIDDHMFVLKMKIISSKHSDVYPNDVRMVEQLLERIQIIESPDECLRDGFAMTLVRSANSPHHLHWTSDRSIVEPILRYALNIFPEDFDRCELPMKMSELTFTLVNCFVDVRVSQLKSPRNNLEIEYRRRMAEFQQYLQLFRTYFELSDARHKKITRIKTKVDRIVGCPNSKISLRGCVSLEHRVFDERQVAVYKKSDFSMKRYNGVFLK